MQCRPHTALGASSPDRGGPAVLQRFTGVARARRIVFDRNNNLLFVDVATGRVFKLTPERQLSIVLKENSFGASGPAVHKDGRIFIASVGDMQRGSVRAIEPNGTREQMIVAPDAGFLVNDRSLIIRADFISLTAGEIQPIHRVGCSTLVPMSGQFMPSCPDSRSGTA